MKNQSRRPSPRNAARVSFASQFAAQLGVVRARLEMEQGRKSLEAVAAELGADLTDPEEFRTVQALADER